MLFLIKFKMNDLTVIIPNYNGKDLLEDCLKSLEEQNIKNFEILVVDDCSTDNSIEILKKYPVRVIQNKENLGFASSVNIGILNSRSKYVLLLNNDVIVNPNFLREMYSSICANKNCFSVSSKMIRFYERDIIDDTGDNYTLFGWVYKRGDGDSVLDYSQPDSVFSACAGAGIYNREALIELGLFDQYHFAYLEDVDIGWRAQINGFENLYNPKAQCYHIGSATLAQGNKYSPLKVFLSARNNIFIIYKNMPIGQILFNLPFLSLGFFIKALYFAKQGYKDVYLDGLKVGLLTCHRLDRQKYQSKNFKNYLRIQKEMILATIGYSSKKIFNFVKNRTCSLIKKLK